MKLTNDMKRRIKDMESFAEKVNAVLRIKPRMEVIRGGKKNEGRTFDLRSLNMNLVARE